MKARAALVTVVLATGCAAPAREPPGEPRGEPPARAELPRPDAREVEEVTAAFEALSSEFLAWHFEADPVRATALGVHAHDHRFPDLSRRGIQRRIDALLEWSARVGEVPRRLLRGDARLDHAVLDFAIRAALLDLEELRRWTTDPRLYTGTIATGLAELAEPGAGGDRREALLARLEGAPALLEAARENLVSPPREWTELGIGEARGLLEWVGSGPLASLAGGAGALDTLEAALRAHITWLEEELLPRSTGEYRLGEHLFLRKLLYEEHVDVSAEELDRLNRQAIERYRAWLAEVAAEVDPDRTPEAILDSIARLHPEPGALVATAARMMDSARAWVLESGVVTVPVAEDPVVREAPPYARSGFAAMDVPGPFESEDVGAYFHVTPVDAAWTPEQRREHLTYFARPALLGIVLHETYPGHYVQLVAERDVESDVRRVFTPRSFVEGWAHYAEQMALDEGFADGDAVARLGQLRRALQRHARWHASLHVHAFGTPLDRVVEDFMEIARFEAFPARREVIRATYDPTYLYYALGRMQILQLRDDYRAHREGRGEPFELRDFHDRLLRLGLPVGLAREALIPAPRAAAQNPRR